MAFYFLYHNVIAESCFPIGNLKLTLRKGLWMMKKLINLQLMAEGGASAAAPGAEGGAATGVEGAFPVAQTGEDLSQVVYGKANVQDVANPNDAKTTDSIDPAERMKQFDNLIKKGGEYANEFNKRTQSIIDKRFKEMKTLEETLKSHDSIMGLLAAKYGVDATDAKALEKAINDDTSLFEEAAYKEGLSAEQYRQKLQLEQENARLKAAQEEAQRNAGAEQIYAKWLAQADEVKAKYGVDFDMASEMENPEFTQLLGAGIDFEAAYKTIHFDDMLNGAMAVTAQNVSQAMVNNIQSRSRRPAENGTQSANSTIFKADPSKWTDSDMDEVIKRVAGGADIAL